jgi:predicted benzoate:H+ symporter BenE
MNATKHNRDRKRSLGAIIGLVAGLSLMSLLGLGGVLYGFVFGAGGTVIGGMIGERFASDSVVN